MPGERKPSFTVVSLTLAALTVFGFVMKRIEPHIPPRPANALADERSEFLRQAGNHSIQWLEYGEEAIRQSKARGVPVMLVLGTTSSKFGRDLDRFVFTDNRVSTFLSRNFVPARLDLYEEPEWRNAFVPLSRAGDNNRFLPDLQVAFITPDGRLFDFVVRRHASFRIDANEYLAYLVRARDIYESLLDNEPVVTVGGIHQEDRQKFRLAGGLALPDLRAFAAFLSSKTHPEHGGYPFGGFQNLWPAAWEFLALAGLGATLERSLDPALTTGVVDWVDGGFFHRARGEGWQFPEFDKVAVLQAGMTSVLTRAALLREPEGDLHLDIARLSFDSLVDKFAKDGLFLGERRGDERSLDRSNRASFWPRRLWDWYWQDEITYEEWELLRDHLGLDLSHNRPMVLRVKDSSTLRKDGVQRLLDKLRGLAPDDSGSYASHGYLDVSGYVAARLIESARLMGDQDRLLRASRFADELDAFRAADDVMHRRAGGDYAYLGDYLAYADAKLQDFLSNGRVPSLSSGLRVLRRALVLFRGPDEGSYIMSLGGSPHTSIPEVVDNRGESCIGQLIRLLDGYSRLVPEPEGLELRRAAYATASRFAGLAPETGIFSAGYLAGVLRLQNERYAVAVGNNAVAQANALARQSPSFVVAPALGSVREDLQSQEPGIYVIESGVVAGPLTVQAAASRLGPSLRLSP